MDVYEACPQFASDRFLLRQTSMEDRDDLLTVYSDTAAVPIFNSDNCTGDFYMTRPEDMAACIDFWLQEYAQRYYVRWSIVDRDTSRAVGTIELFHREASDFFNHVGLLRLDLRSDYETEDIITEVLSALLPPAFDWFSCGTIATKIPPCAKVRRSALLDLGFEASGQLLYGHDGTPYDHYYVLDAQKLLSAAPKKDRSGDSGLETAYFASGCFWCITPSFQERVGVRRVTSGYSGGAEDNPSYLDVKQQRTGHRETIQVTYNPAKISYQELFDVFLGGVDPFDGGGQFIDRGHSYTLAVYYCNEAQRKIAEDGIRQLEAQSGEAVQIAVEPFQSFYPAEDYHQDYYRKHPVEFEQELVESGRKKTIHLN